VYEVWRCLFDVLYSHIGEEQAGHSTVLHVPVVQPAGAQYLKGQCHEIFCFRFFSRLIFHQAPENNIRVILNYFRKFSEIFACQSAPPISTTPVASTVMGTISACWHLKVNLKKKIYVYVNSTTQRCQKIIKTFRIFHLELRISPQMFEEFQNCTNSVLRISGKTYSLKKLKSNISWHCPFKWIVSRDNIFEAFKNSGLSIWSLIVSNSFAWYFEEKSNTKYKVSACYFEITF
jgi:hypothetical protein